MIKSIYFRTASALVGLTLVAGCNSKAQAPAGQVAATIDGEEVTLQELNTEVQASNFPESADKKVAQQVALQRVIDRKLVVKAAAEKGLDKTPEYLSQMRRGDEMLLTQVYARQQLAAVPVPTDADITKFMAEHGNAFSGRQQLTFDQIRFAMPTNPAPLKALEAVHSMADVAATLTRLGIKFERSPAAIDSAAVPTAVIGQIDKLPPTEPFALPGAQGMMTVNVVTGRRPIANEDKQARAAAVSAWRQEKFTTLLTGQVAALKNKTKIQYQNGFAPPPANAAAGAKPAAAGAAPAAPKG